VANKAGAICWIVQRGIGYVFAGPPTLQKVAGGRYSVRVYVERLMEVSDIWKAQYGVVKRPQVKQFLPDNHCQASSKPKLEPASENETPAIKPSAAVLPGEGRKNVVRVCEAIQTVAHDAGPRFAAIRCGRNRGNGNRRKRKRLLHGE
jgi:hypothetical protein